MWPKVKANQIYETGLAFVCMSSASTTTTHPFWSRCFLHSLSRALFGHSVTLCIVKALHFPCSLSLDLISRGMQDSYRGGHQVTDLGVRKSASYSTSVPVESHKTFKAYPLCVQFVPSVCSLSICKSEQRTWDHTLDPFPSSCGFILPKQGAEWWDKLWT